MQEGDSITAPYGAYLSWENSWHAWGNNQAYTLLRTHDFYNDKSNFNSSLKEILNFYPYAKNRALSVFELKLLDDEIVLDGIHQYPQIAYNIRPMVFACLEAYNITKDSLFAIQAGHIASWLFGDNPNGQKMYFPESGICYDGIISENEINHNSGAESTIEALLTLLEVENNPISAKTLYDYISNKSNNR